MRRSLSLLTTTASLLLGATCLTQAMAEGAQELRTEDLQRFPLHSRLLR